MLVLEALHLCVRKFFKVIFCIKRKFFQPGEIWKNGNQKKRRGRGYKEDGMEFPSQLFDYLARIFWSMRSFVVGRLPFLSSNWVICVVIRCLTRFKRFIILFISHHMHTITLSHLALFFREMPNYFGYFCRW